MKFLLPFVSGLCNPVNTIMDLDLDSSFDMGRALSSGNIWGWEREVFACLLACISSSPTPKFLDIGANIGFYTLTAKMLFGNNLPCLAVEANPKAVQKIRSLATANHVDVEICECAIVGNSAEFVDFYIYQADSNSSCIKNAWAIQELRVPATTLSAINTGYNIIKIDTEGTEYEILKPEIRNIASASSLVIIELLNKEAFNNIFSLFTSHGYSVYLLKKDFEITRVDSYPGFGNREYNYLLSPWPKIPEYFMDNHYKWGNAISLTSDFILESSIQQRLPIGIEKNLAHTALQYFEYRLASNPSLILFPLVSDFWLAFYPSDFPRLIHYEFTVANCKLYFGIHFELSDGSINRRMKDRLMAMVFPHKRFLSFTISPVDMGKMQGIAFGIDFKTDFFSLDTYLDIMGRFVDITVSSVRNIYHDIGISDHTKSIDNVLL